MPGAFYLPFVGAIDLVPPFLFPLLCDEHSNILRVLLLRRIRIFFWTLDKPLSDSVEISPDPVGVVFKELRSGQQ